MKKYLFLILFLVFPGLLYADTAKVCEPPKPEVAKIEKKATKPTCNFSPRVSDKKNKDKEDKTAKETKVQAVKVPVKAVKSIQEPKPQPKPQPKKKAEPVKAVKPVKEAVAKSKAKEVKPKTEQPVSLKKVKAPKPLLPSKPASKKAAPSISVKPLKSAQEAELQKIERAKPVKTVKPVSSSKRIKAQEAAFQKIEKKTVQKIPESAPVAKPAEAVEEIVQEEKHTFKYKTVGHDAKNLAEPRKMDRIESSIVVPVAADNEELELIFSDLLEKELAANKKLDALWVIAYAEGEYPGGLPKAYGIWSPPGGWYDWHNTSDKSQYKWEYRFLRGDSIPR